MIMMDSSSEERLQSYIESEGKSCSFDTEVIVVHGSRFFLDKGLRLYN